MDEDKRKHLEFIQGVINRHNSNSFMIKGWTITITAALYALAGTLKEPSLVLIALAPIVMFWGLDAFYLSNERCFVDLYNAVSNNSPVVLPNTKILKKNFNGSSNSNYAYSVPNYNMNFKKFKVWKDNSWVNVLKSKTILGLYLSMIIVTVVIFIFLNVYLTKRIEPIEVNAKINPSEIKLNLKTEPPKIINNIFTEPANKDSSTINKAIPK